MNSAEIPSFLSYLFVTSVKNNYVQVVAGLLKAKRPNLETIELSSKISSSFILKIVSVKIAKKINLNSDFLFCFLMKNTN